MDLEVDANRYHNGEIVAQNTDLLFRTDDWVEIYRTPDEWEAKLVQAVLGNEYIRCRVEHSRSADGQRQVLLFVAPEDQIEALEVVSRISLTITSDESERQRQAGVGRDHTADDQKSWSEVESPKETPAAVEQITIAEREGIGKVVHHVGRGYELQAGQEPYYMVEENRWEEFTDFSAQRQEFSILLQNEYPILCQWLKQEKLMVEFIRLVESTYREVPPPRPRKQQRSTIAPTANANSTNTADARTSNLAKFSLWVSLVSLAAVILRLPWYASLILSVLAVITVFVAKYRIDTSEGTLKGSLIAFLAIIIACIVIAITWKQQHSNQPESSDLRSVYLFLPMSSESSADREAYLTLPHRRYHRVMSEDRFLGSLATYRVALNYLSAYATNVPLSLPPNEENRSSLAAGYSKMPLA